MTTTQKADRTYAQRVGAYVEERLEGALVTHDEAAAVLGLSREEFGRSLTGERPFFIFEVEELAEWRGESVLDWLLASDAEEEGSR